MVTYVKWQQPLIIEKKFSEEDYLQLDIQFANGPGVDAPLQGGAMVNNDVMEDPAHHNEPYIAKAFYEHHWHFFDQFELILDIGKFGVNDFFDVGKDVSDQTSQFLNQAINNNGAFDYVQDLEGHGYTYGARFGLGNDSVMLDVAFFSSDSYLQNISKKNSVVVGLTWTPEWYPGIKSVYQIYGFSNFGEYARFDNQGRLISKDVSKIGTEDNADDLSKTGFGISINHSFPSGINVFGKYGRQDDDRDVRHYQDMDETYMVGFDIHGENWNRENDVFGIAFEIDRLTGNHRKAQERGYEGFFSRTGGIGKGNYADERVLEVYYKYAFNNYVHISADYQWINNFYYSKLIGDVHFLAGRLNVTF
ncbi:carbohydrate porin [methane-oxidizing endosymbiont of Gigantopelta aegis]|uniref:carbohydrate porin n=1 Tax=methane-oxidizing endosymbiont of Gigantopelta aegis TaxID=2794938 RepID=UPI0018DC8DFE|nr:carbohydrate porin [methane-oxidizing endosymbiont of Gigantopelta aegis]